MSNNITPVEIQNYINFMNSNDSQGSIYVTKERIDANFENYGKAMNTLLVYPDIFSDIMTPRGSSFSMFFEQRLVLRAMARFRQSYFTFTRAFSKSFLSFFMSYQTCMFVPHYKAFITAGTKKQGALIAREKVIDDLWVKFPLLANEMHKFRTAGKLRNPWTDAGDSVIFKFSNGSQFDVVGGSIRGGRRNGGLFEEVIDQDPDYINEEVIPLLNTIRYNRKGELNPYEPQGRKIFVTTAGYQNSFAYDKLMETLCLSLIDPKKYIVMGGSYKVLLMHNRLSEDTMRELLSSPSYKPEQLDREYRSIWSSAVVGAAFNPNVITNLRKMKRAELHYYEHTHENYPDDFYVISVDMSKDGDAATAVVIYRVSYGEYNCNYRVVNAYGIDNPDYEVVANVLKTAVTDYQAKMLIYDANGVGAGLRDWLNKPTKTKDGEILLGLGIINPPSKIAGTLIQYREPWRNVCYEIKSGGSIASDIHKLFFAKISSGNVRFLVKSQVALNEFQKNKSFALASRAKKDAVMRPYFYTDQLEVELKNLDIKDTTDNTTNYVMIERRNKNIQKDFFSASEYGIYAVVNHIEMPYYKEKAKKAKQKVLFLSSGGNGAVSSTRRGVSSKPRRGRGRR